MSQAILRLAVQDDAQALLQIYAPYVLDTVISFEYTVPTLNEFIDRIKRIEFVYPYLVCEIDGKPVGYAYAHRHMERSAYQWNAELSIYIEQAHTTMGIGKALYGALIDILAMQNIRNLYCCIATPNEKSEALHKYFGFTRVGVYRNIGFKADAWHDITWFEKHIGDNTTQPMPLIPIHSLDIRNINEVLKKYSALIRL